jgi:hypothetical protein
MGDSWVHLRECLICGHVGCCDSSPDRHATAHYHATGHPIVRSFEPGEDWRWCYVDEEEMTSSCTTAVLVAAALKASKKARRSPTRQHRARRACRRRPSPPSKSRHQLCDIGRRPEHSGGARLFLAGETTLFLFSYLGGYSYIITPGWTPPPEDNPVRRFHTSPLR